MKQQQQDFKKADLKNQSQGRMDEKDQKSSVKKDESRSSSQSADRATTKK